MPTLRSSLVGLQLIALSEWSDLTLTGNPQQTGPYHFTYQINADGDGAAGHIRAPRAESAPSSVKGAYGFRKPTGDYRIVDYLAKRPAPLAAGIKNNDPGTSTLCSSREQTAQKRCL